MKTIDIKSLIIGALLTSTIFLGVAATYTINGGNTDVFAKPIQVEFTVKNGTALGTQQFK